MELVRSVPAEPEVKPTLSVNTLKQLAAALQSIPTAAAFEAALENEEDEAFDSDTAVTVAPAPAPAPAPTPAPAPDFSAQVASIQRLRDDLNKKEKELKTWEARLRDREASLELREAVLQEQEANALTALKQRSSSHFALDDADMSPLPQPLELPPPPPQEEQTEVIP